jgi:hypothetical protein
MTQYVFRCRNCDTPFIADTRQPDMPYCCDEPTLVRDYRAEGVGFALKQLKVEREHNGREAIRDMFLETAAEAATPDDPDGSKAIEQWNETFTPAEGNKRPMRPERPLHSKKVF